MSALQILGQGASDCCCISAFFSLEVASASPLRPEASVRNYPLHQKGEFPSWPIASRVLQSDSFKTQHIFYIITLFEGQTS